VALGSPVCADSEDSVGCGGADRALRAGSRDVEHIGSAHDETELKVLKAATRQRLTAGQGGLHLGLGSGRG
jgi:hypothetical protein